MESLKDDNPFGVFEEELPKRSTVGKRIETNEEDCNFNIDDEEEMTGGKRAVNKSIRSTNSKLISFT